MITQILQPTPQSWIHSDSIFYYNSRALISEITIVNSAAVLLKPFFFLLKVAVLMAFLLLGKFAKEQKSEAAVAESAELPANQPEIISTRQAVYLPFVSKNADKGLR